MMKRGKSAASGQQRAVSACQPARAHGLRAAHCPLPTPYVRGGFTLIELLITMTIIAIISAAILGTAAAAFENARRSRTQSLITKISGLVLERWDSYANRRLDINPLLVNEINQKYQSNQITAAQRGKMLADARLIGLRELMKMEMPDSYRDVAWTPQILASTPPLTFAYRRSYATGNEDSNDIAEHLYKTVMYATGDGEARTLFNSQDIGDTDGDGAPEFIDGWGNPIRWIRWPSGFVSDLQPAQELNRNIDDHDPFDVFKRDSPERLLVSPLGNPDPSHYPVALRAQTDILNLRNSQVQPSNTRLAAVRFVPLVFSNGTDGEAALAFYGNSAGLDPYGLNEDQNQPGQVDGSSPEWRDNIHNHLNQY
jgi:prepilin-type N-terminal cleavage/methylation domain-containing protein